METISRRQIIGSASLAVGTIALGTLGCGGSATPPPEECPEPTTCPDPTVCPDPPTCPPEDTKTTQFPYRQFIPATFRFDVAKAKEDAYHGYYAGACCHGVYAALLDQLATLGSPFDRLPRDLMRFGGGGIASYGSICGALLGGVMIQAMISDATARDPMMTELMRWYEKTPFPSYIPQQLDAKETGTTLDFADPVPLQEIPNSHLCHASVSDWCRARGVSSGSADKKARCSRLTADVAAKLAVVLNAYLDQTQYEITPVDTNTQRCTGCHTKGAANPPTVASGMECTTCHGDPHGVAQ